jgi:small subunit ribosomal protein S7
MLSNNLFYFHLKSNLKKLNIKYHKTYINLFKYKIFRSDLISTDLLDTVNSIHDVDLIQSNLHSIYNINNILSILKSNQFKLASKFIYKIRTRNLSLSKTINSKLVSIQSKDPLNFINKKHITVPYNSINYKNKNTNFNIFNRSTSIRKSNNNYKSNTNYKSNNNYKSNTNIRFNTTFKSNKSQVPFNSNLINFGNVNNKITRQTNNNNRNYLKNISNSSINKRYYTVTTQGFQLKKQKLLSHNINPINYISLKQLSLFTISIGSIYYLTSKYKDHSSMYLNLMHPSVSLHYITFFRKLKIITLFKEVNYFWNILFKNILFERFLNRLLKHGLKFKCEKMLYNTFRFIKLKYKKNPFRIFFKAFLNVLPCLEPKPLKFGRQIKMIPTHLHTRRRFFLACKWLIHHSKAKLKNKYKFEKRPFFKKFARELLSSYRKKSKSFLDLITLHTLSFDARINMHLLRRRKSKYKRRIFISRKRRKTAYYFK